MPTNPAHKNWLSHAASVWWTGALLSLGVGLALYLVTALSIEHDAHQRFQNQARNAQYAIAARVRAYTDVLRSAASFFQATERVDRASFHRYVNGLHLPQEFATIDNINFAQYVTDGQRDHFERAVRASARAGDGYPAFAIDPPARRADYAIITLIEPVDQFGEKLGADIAARPAVAHALALSRDTGAPATSGQLIAVPGQPGRAKLAMRMPVYRQDMALDSVSHRRAAYLGSVGIGFSVRRLVQAALDEIGGHDLHLALYDDGALDEPRPRGVPDTLLFASPAGGAGGAAARDSFTTTLAVECGGRLWQAQFSAPKAAWHSRVDRYLPWIALDMGSLVTLLLYLLFHTLATSRRRAVRMAKGMTRELRDSQASLQRSHHQLRRLAAHADRIKEQERKRIAREIHDDLGQNLLVLRIEADLLAARTRQRHPRLHARARTTLGQIDRTICSVRHIINDLRPAVLDLGLCAAVEWQIEQFRQHAGLACELAVENDITVDDLCATAFFRVLQESLSNVLQHAHASAVRVTLRQRDGMLTMTISDNGVGIAPGVRNKPGSFGLVGIEERIGLLGGHCTISGGPLQGTTVTVSVPVAGPADAPAPQSGGSEHLPHEKSAGSLTNINRETIPLENNLPF
ncbi:CHASE domain-containing protein [Duganella sp. FT3S]|uniref:CHASE domain-containing protein n=1 Tax=Rugamonas fusca TaxID=2758568 RepID=A0A7W2I6B3_9BURK|nr:CHASE domain-containing protein [Rugamonas fusca]MBA5605282.1 CHASE domain-containing protein [Rugamonas fusca]